MERSGSTWFSSLLARTGVAGRPEEYWELGAEAAAHRQKPFRTYADYLAYVRRQSATPNGVIGVNVMWRQMPGALNRMRRIQGWERLGDLELWQRALPGLRRFVYTYRSDVLGQAISWTRAAQTRQFTSLDVKRAEPNYDSSLIEFYHMEIEAHCLAWEAWFTANGIEPLRVRYEDLLADPVGTVRTAVQFLGLELPAGYEPRSRYSVQRDRLTEVWRERALADRAGRYIRPEQYEPA